MTQIKSETGQFSGKWILTPILIKKLRKLWSQEVTFSRKFQKKNHNPVYFNHKPVQQVLSQKHLGMYTDAKLNFQEHLNDVLSKVNKTFGLLCKL